MRLADNYSALFLIGFSLVMYFVVIPMEIAAGTALRVSS